MTDNNNNALLTMVEARMRELELEVVRQRGELNTLERDYKRIDAEFNVYQERVRSGWGKFLWILGGGFLSGIITWILKGGLINVG